MRMEDMACLRQAAYSLFSWALVCPDESRLKTVAEAASSLQGLDQHVARFGFFPHWRRMITSLIDIPPLEVLEQEYIRVFMYNSGKMSCQPYESKYTTGEQDAGWLAASLEQEYAAAGLALSPTLNDLPDHIAVELEFMAFLCGKEAGAWSKKDMAGALGILDTENAFLKQHLALWVPEWSGEVAVADDGGIYTVVTETVRAFTSHDRDLLDILRHRFQAVSPKVKVGAQGEEMNCSAHGCQARCRGG